MCLKLSWTNWRKQAAVVTLCPMKTLLKCLRMLSAWWRRWRIGTLPLRKQLLWKKEIRPRNVRYLEWKLQYIHPIAEMVVWLEPKLSIAADRKCNTSFPLFNFLVLDYIQANVSKQCDDNEAAADKIQDLLGDYKDKLKDLDKALKEATDLVKKANTQNGLNNQALGDLQVQTPNRYQLWQTHRLICYWNIMCIISHKLWMGIYIVADDIKV